MMKNVFVYEVVLANIFTGLPREGRITVATPDPGKLLDLAVAKLKQTQGGKINPDHYRAFASVTFAGFAALDPDA